MIIKKELKKIVLLMLSNIEIIYVFGFGDKVVGVIINDIYLKEVKKVEKVGDMNVNVEKVIFLKLDFVFVYEFFMLVLVDVIK